MKAHELRVIATLFEQFGEMLDAVEPFIKLAHVFEHSYDGGKDITITLADLTKLRQAVEKV